QRGVATNGSGEFELAGVPGGQYTLEVTAVGYQPHRQFYLAGLLAAAIEISLKIEVSNMNESVVIASRRVYAAQRCEEHKLFW
ncbi:MAG: carboxypeptidase-like regulatory domain-containing protein, partial [Bacteroidetes bacterium]|nr:carboxypeptidase-like regulatory domain-containing protein [Bacteroidota bacterium]